MALDSVQTKIWGTSPDSIDTAEDRERFEAILRELDILQPANGIARSYDEALKIAQAIDYPVVVRPSYVLGGRANGNRLLRPGPGAVHDLRRAGGTRPPPS